MHLSHKVDWGSISSHLVYIHENKSITPHRTDLFFRDESSQAKSLDHFARTLAGAIREFSATERAKFPTRGELQAAAAAPLPDTVFSDEILERYHPDLLPHSSLTAQTQSLEYWIACAEPQGAYNTSNGILADVVKVLLAENELGRCLMLANHPRIPLGDLHSLSWGHSFGWDHTRDWALRSYIFLNVVLARPELMLADAKYKRLKSYERMVCFAGFSGDFDAQTYLHRMFWFGSLDACVPENLIDPFVDAQRLHEHLKTCFRVLYQYDVLARECGKDDNWESTITDTVSSLWTVKTEYHQDDDQGWIRRFA